MIADEKYEFKPETKRNILILGVVGIVLLIAGILSPLALGDVAFGQRPDGRLARGADRGELHGPVFVADDHAAGRELPFHRIDASWLALFDFECQYVLARACRTRYATQRRVLALSTLECHTKEKTRPGKGTGRRRLR